MLKWEKCKVCTQTGSFMSIPADGGCCAGDHAESCGSLE